MRYVTFFAIVCTLAGCAAERDRIIYQRHAGYDNYCHTKVETSARTGRPGDREIVDFYGPCDAFDNGSSTLRRRAEPGTATQ